MEVLKIENVAYSIENLNTFKKFNQRSRKRWEKRMGKNQRKKFYFIILIGFDVILKSTCKTIKNMAIFGPNSIKNQLLLLFYYETLLILFYSLNTLKKISK